MSDEIIEVRVEMRAFRVQALCPKCTKANMEFTGHTRLTMPPQYDHVCANAKCRHKAVLRDRYPTIRYEEVTS